jgi:hypothetical protein
VIRTNGEPPNLAAALALALEARGVSYAIGGALAYSFWGIPRATMDVDINVFVELEAVDPVFSALADVGIAVDSGAARSATQSRGMFEAMLGPVRIDVFLPSIPFSWESERTRKRQLLEGHPVWVLSAEAIAVFKLLFFRPKDVLDLERLIAVQGPNLDRAYIRAHITDMMGDDDVRVVRWDELVASSRDAP